MTTRTTARKPATRATRKPARTPRTGRPPGPTADHLLISIRLSPAQIAALRHIRETRGTPITFQIASALDAYLAREGGAQ